MNSIHDYIPTNVGKHAKAYNHWNMQYNVYISYKKSIATQSRITAMCFKRQISKIFGQIAAFQKPIKPESIVLITFESRT